jgi:PAS domain S-box-containing protein
MKSAANTILIIDDNPMNLNVVKELVLIDFPEAKVLLADGGNEGLDLAIKNDPDVILLDIRMPEMNGFEVCGKIRANPATKDIPVVFLTAFDEAEHRIKALEAGANGFMTKPIDHSELVAQIKTMQKLKAANRLQKEEKNKLELMVAERSAALEKELAERNKAERILHNSEEQFQKLIENLPVSVSIVTLKGEVLYINPKCRELFEIPEDFDYGMGTAFMYWVNADDRHKWIREIKENGEVKNLLLHIKSFRGKEIWAYGSGLFIQYKDETCVLSTHQDITLVKKAQDALRESEEKFSKAFKLSPYALTVTRVSDGKILEVNDAFTHISGYSKEEALNSTTLNLDLWVNPEEREETIALLQKGEIIVGREYQFRKKNRDIVIGSLSMQILTIGGEACIVGSIEDVTKRRKEEQELKQSRRNFYSAFISSPVGLGITNRMSGQVKVVNDVYCKILEYDAGEIVGKNVVDLNIYSDQDERNRILEQLQNEGNIRNQELAVRTKNKNLRFVLVSMEPIVYDNEDSIISTFIDITDRKKAEAELKTNYSLLQMAAKTARFGGWSVDLKTNICTWSDAVAEIHEMPVGYSPPLSEGISFYAPEHRSAITEAFFNCAQKGINYDLELQIIASSGRRVWIRTIGEAVMNENGTITDVIGSFQDIDEQKNMIAALRESEQKFKGLADNAQVLISIISLKGNTKYLYVNKEWEKVTGYSKKDLDSITPIDMAHPDVRDTVMKNAQNRLQNLPAPKRYDSKIIIKTGETKTLDFSAVPIIYENEPAILTAAIDITERKKTEQELKERMDELERFQRLTVDRELNMIELKKEVNKLLEKIGENPKYRIVE